MTRLLPDVEAMLHDFLNDVPASTKMPEDIATALPHRLIYKLGGVALHPQFLDRPQVQIASLAATRAGASDLAETAREALFWAWRQQTRMTEGGFHKVVEVVSPFEVRTGTEPDGVYRFDQTVQVWTRP
jgi:hypothetical protein